MKWTKRLMIKLNCSFLSIKKKNNSHVKITEKKKLYGTVKNDEEFGSCQITYIRIRIGPFQCVSELLFGQKMEL